MYFLKFREESYRDYTIRHRSPVVPWPQNRTLAPARTRGIIVSGDSLALQSVHRRMAGRYSCRAANFLGAATSTQLRLKLSC